MAMSVKMNKFHKNNLNTINVVRDYSDYKQARLKNKCGVCPVRNSKMC